ncbi:M20 metallopeptidase family protein [Sphingobacteruim zhuxiongii]|uniref:M20 metallopeptidase family protein n=1 Tax=Sphingobacterium zhuxiongii TaxID=2662364 RepID=UPI001920E5F5|nr:MULTISPECIES: amidohydrolase [unclassified Sphingobacterium]
MKEINHLIEQSYPQLVTIYQELHANPELSLQEANTSKLLVAELGKLGIQVTENVGGFGIVGVLANGDGPTVMIRTDMDALPILEETGLPFASTKVVKDPSGKETPVMHACGHDFHMTTWLGLAKIFMQMKSKWKGTLVFVGQPAEEIGAGARAMIADGLFTKFPKPDYALAIHVNPNLKAGTVGYCPGFALSNVDNVAIVVRGKGGHGASPHTGIDPIVIASKIVLSLQTIVSRELSPVNSPSVITVGAIHGGTLGNIIPNEVEMKLTVRSFGKENRQFLLDRIKNTARGIAIASNVKEADLPIVKVNEQYTPSVYNNPALTNLLSQQLEKVLGAENIIHLTPEMVGEDFSNYTALEPTLPTLIYSVGTSNERATADGKVMNYPVHNGKFQPVLDPSLKTAILSMAYSVFVLLDNKN